MVADSVDHTISISTRVAPSPASLPASSLSPEVSPLPQTRPTPRLNKSEKLRTNFPRVKTGCLTCRRRKKKCDESRPDCAGCRRNHELCEWPSPPGTNKRQARPSETCDGKVSKSGTLHEFKFVKSQVQTMAHALAPAGACRLTRVSGLLLDHYLHNTGRMLATVPAQQSPFLTHIIPLANVDDLLMHSVLALGGTHLAFIKDNDIDIQAATLQHYLAALHGLRGKLESWNKWDADKTPNLLLVLILLGHYEIISGDTKDTLHHHLRASRELINSLPSFHNHFGNCATGQSILGLCLELYAYILITNSYKPRGLGPGHTVEYDDFVMCLSNLGTFATFGTMFGDFHGLFELIPRITLFAAQRLTEEASGDLLPSPESRTMKNLLEQQIDQWVLDHAVTRNNILWKQTTEAAGAAEAMHHALRIYLATALAGSIVSDEWMRSLIQGHIDAIISATQLVSNSQFATLLLWPLLVAGSCMTDPGQQHRLILSLKGSRYHMKHVFRVCDVLQRMWQTESSHAYGPYGLFLMQQMGYSFPVL